MTDHDLDRILETLKSDDGAHLGSVTSRVMAQIDSRRHPTVPWWSVAAAAAAVAAAIIAVYLAIPAPVARPELAVNLPSAPPATGRSLEFGHLPDHQWGSQSWLQPPFRRRMAGPEAPLQPTSGRPSKRPVKAEPLEVRMQTDDPDVLIIWLVDDDTEQQLKGHP